MRLFYLLFVLFAAGHVYVFIALRRAFGGGKWQFFVLAWLAAMVVSWLWRFGRPMGFLGEKFQDITFYWMGFFILLCYCLIAADLTALLSRAASLLTRAEAAQRIASFLTAARYVPVALGIAVFLYAYSLYEARTPRVTPVVIATKKLPPGSRPLRIAGIADVHLSSIIDHGRLKRMVDLIAAQRPDMLLIAGDLVDTDLSRRSEDAELLASIPAPLGKFAVTGNHEYYRGLGMSLDFMKKSGLRVLRGEAVESGGILIAGVDDSNFAGSFGPETTDITLLAQTLPQGTFILLMNHKPYYPPETVGRFDLMFSGHTHGGQFWPGRHIVRRIYEAEQGLNVLRRDNKTSLLFITNGIGFWGPPIRFLTPPEIVVFTIEPEPSPAPS